MGFFLVSAYLRVSERLGELERGTSIVEYALLLTFVGVLAAGALKILGASISEPLIGVDCVLDDPQAAC